jgi:hypothetical protein
VRPLIPGRVLDRDGTPAGMCFEVAPAILVTAYGVLDNRESSSDTPVVVLAPNGNRIQARVLARDSRHDLAVLESEYPLPAMAIQLANSDNVRWGTRVWVGDVRGRWRGTSTGDRIEFGLVEAPGIPEQGMGGAPVVRISDGAVIGVLSHLHNVADGRRDRDLRVTRTEHLRPLLGKFVRGAAAAPQTEPDTAVPSMNPDAQPGVNPDMMMPDEPCMMNSPGVTMKAPPRGATEAPPRQDKRWLRADMPTAVPLGSDVSLLVSITATPPDLASASTGLKPFPVRPGGTRVAIIVEAQHGLTPVEPLEQHIRVPETGDSEPVRFAFRADQPGLFKIRVYAFAGGSYLGELLTEVSVEEGARSINPSAKGAALAQVRAEPGEVTLQVRYDGEQYTFQLLSESYLFEPVIASALTAKPGEAVERTVAVLREMAIGGSEFTDKNARTWMEGTGIGLWNDMVPDLIKEQFWQLRDSIGSFSIACGQDTIPWELLYPLSGSRDDGFLVEQFPVLRRVYGQCRIRRMSVAPSLFVVPDGAPSNAQDELAALSALLPGPAGVRIRDLEPLLAMINSGAIGMLHFACHNTFRSAEGGSSIAMGGGRFDPTMLNRAVTIRSLATRGPLVFINACRSAAFAPQYTRLMGWAGQFMAAGAGAFVGSLWPVRSSSALAFAEAFYGALLSGQALGRAALAARQATASDTADPTWLAYTVYGDPMATVTGASDAGP